MCEHRGKTCSPPTGHPAAPAAVLPSLLWCLCPKPSGRPIWIHFWTPWRSPVTSAPMPMPRRLDDRSFTGSLEIWECECSTSALDRRGCPKSLDADRQHQRKPRWDVSGAARDQCGQQSGSTLHSAGSSQTSCFSDSEGGSSIRSSDVFLGIPAFLVLSFVTRFHFLAAGCRNSEPHLISATNPVPCNFMNLSPLLQ